MLKKLQTLLAQIRLKKYDKDIAPVAIHSGAVFTTPMALNTSRLEEELINHEGIKHYAYLDTTNNWTIGIGRNISVSGPGISTEECIYMLRNDISRCRKELSKIPWYETLDTVRQEFLIELCFNIGYTGVLQFKQMLINMQMKDFVKAAKELLDSKWATQVGENRANNMANRLRTGNY